MTERRLFVPIRGCCCCGKSAPRRGMPRDGAAVMGMDFGLYRPSVRVKAKRRPAGSLAICEDCYAAITAEGRRIWVSERMAKFLVELRNMMSDVYKAALSEDENAA